MPDSHRNNDDPLGRYALLVGGLTLAALLFGLLGYSGSVQSRREALAEYARRSCTDGYQESCQGNMADIRAARAAYDTVDLGIWQLVTGLAGLVLIGWTLQATRAAVREATDASSAAREAIGVTREAMHRQLRAYIGITSVELDEGRKTIKICVKNFGQTPCHDLVLKTHRYHFKATNDHHPFVVLDPGVASFAFLYLEKAIDVSRYYGKEIDVPCFDAILSWTDVFDEPHARASQYLLARHLKLKRGQPFPFLINGGTSIGSEPPAPSDPEKMEPFKGPESA